MLFRSNENKKRSIAFKSLGQLRYLSALKYMDLVLGNSSSGILEVPSFNIPTINIGDRQKGRILSESVIQTEPNSSDLSQSFAKATDPSYLKKIKNQKQLYGSGNTAKKIMSILRHQTDNDLKKTFHDIQF